MKIYIDQDVITIDNKPPKVVDIPRLVCNFFRCEGVPQSTWGPETAIEFLCQEDTDLCVEELTAFELYLKECVK